MRRWPLWLLVVFFAWVVVTRFPQGHVTLFYSFQGLRALKQRFDPCWELRDLVYQVGLPDPGDGEVCHAVERGQGV